ncbi:MAG: Wzz/FepE/Etk N-terminal domain-containing protein [Chloroflexota bacterium]
MDDVIEIDLRKIVLTLINFRLWIVAGAVILGLAVFLFFFLQPRMYEATAVIALTKPRYLPNFDPRYQTVATTALTNKVAMDIAKSDEIAIFVFDSWNDPQKELEQRRAFRENNLVVKAGSDASVISLTVRLESPEEAARLANLWAQRVVERLNTLYSGQDQSQLAFFETQIAIAQQNLRKAEQALAEFESRNEKNGLQTQLDALIYRQQDLLRKKQFIEQLQRDGRALLVEVENLGASNTLPAELQTRLLVLQLRYAENAPFSEGSGTSLPQFQLSLPVSSTPQSVDEFRTAVQQWQQALQYQVEEIDLLLAEYPQNLTDLQKQIEVLNQERQRLDLEREVAADTYATLNRKYHEVRITMDDSVGDAKIASRALPPIRPAARGTLTYTLAAVIVGAVLAAVAALIRDWWLNGRETTQG